MRAAAIVGNPQLALWHSFGNQAPDDPSSSDGRPGWMYGVRQVKYKVQVQLASQFLKCGIFSSEPAL